MLNKLLCKILDCTLIVEYRETRACKCLNLRVRITSPYKTVMDFKSDAGILNYLKGKEFAIL